MHESLECTVLAPCDYIVSVIFGQWVNLHYVVVTLLEASLCDNKTVEGLVSIAILLNRSKQYIHSQSCWAAFVISFQRMHWNYRIMYTWLYITGLNSLNFNYIFGNFGLHWWVPEGRNMSAFQDEEALYQNLNNLSNNLWYRIQKKYKFSPRKQK